MKNISKQRQVYVTPEEYMEIIQRKAGFNEWLYQLSFTNPKLFGFTSYLIDKKIKDKEIIAYKLNEDEEITN